MTKHTSTRPKPFPKLMIGHNLGMIYNNDVIVLMFTKNRGIVMHITKPELYNKKVGDYSYKWHSKNFEDYNGKITIQN